MTMDTTTSNFCWRLMLFSFGVILSAVALPVAKHIWAFTNTWQTSTENLYATYVPVKSKLKHPPPPHHYNNLHKLRLHSQVIALRDERNFNDIRPVGWIPLRGVLLCFGRYFLAPEALTRAPKARASRGVWGHALPWNFANLGSLKCHFLHFDIISEVGCIFLQY